MCECARVRPYIGERMPARNFILLHLLGFYNKVTFSNDFFSLYFCLSYLFFFFSPIKTFIVQWCILYVIALITDSDYIKVVGEKC